MSTYKVICFQPVSGAQLTFVDIEAAAFMVDGDFVFFVGDDGKAVVAVPLDMNPIVQRTATA